MTMPSTQRDSWVPELTFGARLALVRHRMGWNIKEAALACALPAQSWRGWEVQGHLPRDIISVADQIAGRTGVSRDWLLFGGPIGGAAEPTRQEIPSIDLSGEDRRPAVLRQPVAA